MFAQLEYNFCRGQETKLVIYRSKKDVSDPHKCPLMHIALDNAQLTAFLVDARIKPVNMEE